MQGFVVQAIYVGDDDHARGARFVHARTRFVFDYLQIESAPQAMLYVTTYPTSDDGEPHTQEHLLLGKGNKGRYLGNFEHVMLAESGAFTTQYRTVYDFYTVAGVEAFWPLFRTEIDTLLHPDYTDDEIRREVRDYGTSKDAKGGLSLAEKGTVYNEMVRTFESAETLGWSGMGRLVYGEDHPLALESGGTPEGIRKLTPADIRKFHAAHYQIGNMGTVGAFPASIPLSTVLTHIGETLDSFVPSTDAPTRFMTAADLPAPHGAPAGTLKVVDYPYATTDHPSPAVLAWPATRNLELGERMTLEAFLGAFGGGEGSALYKALIDRKTRVLDVGATSVWSWVSDDQGQPASVWINNVAPAHADEASLRAIRKVVREQLASIAALPDGSKELAAFGERVKARVIEARRATDKFLDTPPEFGARDTGDGWLHYLDDVNRTDKVRRSLTKRDAFEHALAVAGSAKNPWRERIATWGLLNEPYGEMLRASPAMRARLDTERAARVQAELTRLEAAYGVTDPKEALRRRDAEIEHVTSDLAHAEANVVMPPFWSDPPMTNDDALVWRTDTVRGVPVVASTFDSMKSVTVGLELRLDTLPENALPYVALLPSLMSNVGIVRDGVPLSYEDVRDRLRREVLNVDVNFDIEYAADRAELVLTASGNDVDEAKRALAWVRDFLTSPDWRPENLPRIRDVVLQNETDLDNVLTSSEEGWARPLSEAYRKQDRPALSHAACFLTQAYDARRLSWMLRGDEAASAKRVARLLETLAASAKKQDRASLGKLAASLASGKYVDASHSLIAADQPLAKAAGADLAALLAGAPDASVAADWASICTQMSRDLQRPAKGTLAALKQTLATLRHASGARAWIVGSARNQEAVKGDLDALLAALDPAPIARVSYDASPRVLDRARARGGDATNGAVVAFVNPNMANGAIVNSAPGASVDSTGAVLVDFLAASVFSGSGSQSLYKRIWASGLAYNGGIHMLIERGRLEYYSDRIADMPQLVRLLSDRVRAEAADPRFVDYAVAKAFSSRLGERYESRAEAMAENVTDGVTADRVRGFRQRVLALRTSPGLIDAMHARFVPVVGAVLPPLGGASPLPAGALEFAIGPEAALGAYDGELRAARGGDVKMTRLYPRDFWYVGEFAR